tara:strand:- start:302 stop:1363 length:1062 start_codon:yes stop_codon:yes gene_type:complete
MKLDSLILKWYDQNKRDLPWRKTKNPYHIWISEIILQQTRMEQGIYYYNRFISKFPDLESLATSDENDVLLLWQGLGYYSRARNLHHTAKHIYYDLDSKFPESYDKLINLKGIGDYTASAISSICFEKKHPVLDGNVFRIISRIFGIKDPIDLHNSRKVFKKKAFDLLPKSRYGDYNQGLMDFGSIICKPKNPLCSSCFISRKCIANKNQLVDSFPVKAKKNKIKTLYFEYLVVNNNHQILIERIEDGIWKNLYQFPVHISTSKKNKTKIRKFFKSKFDVETLDLKLINAEYIEHKLSHILIKSSFWFTKEKIDIDKGLFTTILDDYPMSKLMHKFIENYSSKFDYSEVKLVN